MPTPYIPPDSEIAEKELIAQHSSWVAKSFAVVSIVFSCALFFGLMLFVIKVFQTFQEIQLHGTGDPKLMAGGISEALVPVILCGPVSCIGLLIAIATLSFSKYRERWFYIWLIVSGCVNLLFVPVGTILAVILLSLVFVKRFEFRKSPVSDIPEYVDGK